MYFAELDQDGNVKQVIVADAAFIAKMPGVWVQTDKRNPSIKYAGIGDVYDPETKKFYPKKPHESWILDKQAGKWKAPKAEPLKRHEYAWDESKKDWVKKSKEEITEIEKIVLKK